MSDTFAKLFNVGGNSRQLLVYREHEEERDVTVLHQVTVIDGIRVDAKVDVQGENQEEIAQRLLEKIDQDGAERLYLQILELVEG